MMQYCTPTRHATALSGLSLLGITLLLLGLICSSAWAAPDYRGIATSLAKQVKYSDDADTVAGKTLVITRFKNRSADEDVDAALLQDKLITAFVSNRVCKVVERERLELALKELKLDAESGLIETTTRKKLGNFLGASYMLVGTISGNAETLDIDARIVSIETGEVVVTAEYPSNDTVDPREPRPVPVEHGIASKVYLISWDNTEIVVSSDAQHETQATRDAVSWLVEKEILDGAQDVLDTWRSDINAKIYRNPERYVKQVNAREEAFYITVNLQQLMRDLTFIIFGKITPRLAIDTTESILHRPPPPDPAVQTTLQNLLLMYGFQVVDSAQARQALRRETLLQAMNGDGRAIRLVEEAAGELQADIFAVGESFADQRTNHDGFDARVEFKLVEGATARMLSAKQNSYSTLRSDLPTADRASDVLAKYALQKAAEQAALRMSAEMLKSFGQPVYRVRVWKFTSFTQRTKIVEGLKEALPGAVVTPTSMDIRKDHCAVFTIQTKRSADAIAEALEAIPQLRLAVSSIECRSLVAEIQ